MIKNLIKNIIHAKGYKVVPSGLGYFDSESIISAAKKEDLSITEYLEKFNIGGVGERRNRVVETLFRVIPHPLKDTIVEIGAGTGMYMEKVLPHYQPLTYEVYETNRGWKSYLSNHFINTTGVVLHTADGTTLNKTRSNSADAVFAHGVFVYLPLLISMGYLQECARVIKKGGYIAFDCFLDDFFSYQTVLEWQNDPHKYDFPVVMGRKILVSFFESAGFEITNEFNIQYHSSESTYFIAQKR